MTETALLPDLSRRWARERPHAPAVLGADLRWSWTDLAGRADAIASAIGDALPTRAGRVGLVLGGSPMAVAALHGATRAGVDAVLLNARSSSAELAAIVTAADIEALVVDAVAPAAVPDGIAALDLEAVAAGDPERTGPIATGPASGRATELVVPTSGTTSEPKLARLPLDRIAASAAAWAAVLPPATGWLLSLGLAHVAGIGIVARAALDGVPVVVPASLDGDGLRAAVGSAADHGVRVSHLSVVATQLARMLDATDDGPPPGGVAAVLVGGGPIPEALVRRATAAGWPVFPSYGMTETASGVVASSPAAAAARPWSAGRPLPGVALRLAASGEILVRGPMVFAGYLGQPAGARADLSGDGWLRTGDVGTLDDDGWLRVLDRHDDLIVSGGENIAPAEVEAVLATHPAVADVGVVGVADGTWGHVPVAAVVLRPGATVSDAELGEHARARLAPFKVPARFERLERLPRSPAGKLLRRRLATAIVGGAEGDGRSDQRIPPDDRRRAAGSATSASPARIVVADDGQPLAVQLVSEGGTSPTVLGLHATLSWSRQLVPLARRLSERVPVALLDRRGSGASRMARPGQVGVVRHVADVIAAMDDLAMERAFLVGHSFGGVVALETAARHPERVAAVLAWEPPYLAVAEPPVRAALTSVADLVSRAFDRGGSAAAAEAFLDVVAGSGSWAGLHPRQRAALAEQGAGALADTAMAGLDPDGLGRIRCPVVLASGDRSEPFYAPIVESLAARIPTAVRRALPDLRHAAPITDPDPVAALVLELIADDPMLEARS